MNVCIVWGFRFGSFAACERSVASDVFRYAHSSGSLFSIIIFIWMLLLMSILQLIVHFKQSTKCFLSSSFSLATMSSKLFHSSNFQRYSYLLFH